MRGDSADCRVDSANFFGRVAVGKPVQENILDLEEAGLVVTAYAPEGGTAATVTVTAGTINRKQGFGTEEGPPAQP